MKKIYLIFVLLPLFAIGAGAQNDSLLISLNAQIKDLQTSVNKLQAKLDTVYNPNRELIPTGEKNKSHFYWSIRFGLFYTHNSYTNPGGSASNLGSHFSYSIKPAIGYVFSPRLSAGCTFIFSDVNFAGLDKNSFQYMIATAMMGGGMYVGDYLSWSISPYVRYKITKVIWDKLNLWGEFLAYGGQKFPRDEKTHELLPSQRSVEYGVKLRPMLTFDLNKNSMIFTSMEFLSWNGSCLVSSDGKLYNNSVNFQVIPIYSILSGLFSIGIIRRF